MQERTLLVHCGFALGLCVTSLARSALAVEQTPVTLTWSAPAECPSREEIVERVNQLLGQGGAANQVPVEVRGMVGVQVDGRFRVEIGILQAGAERWRVLDAPTCSEVAEASAVVIALAISPELESAPKSVTQASSPQPPFKHSATPVRASPQLSNRNASAGLLDERKATRAEAHAEAHSEPRVRAGFATDLGAIDTAAPGVSAAAGTRYGPHVELTLRGTFFPAHSVSVESRPSRGADISLGTLAPVVCAEPFELPLELAVCAEFEVGYLHATGFGSSERFSKTAWWLAPGAGLLAAYPAGGRLRSVVSVDALAPTTRTEFFITNGGVVHRLPSVAGRLGVYLEVAFP